MELPEALGRYDAFTAESTRTTADSHKPLSLLCKASPLIDELALYDVVNTPGVTADLSHISSVAVSTSSTPYVR